jgi:GNAT superfamily N-acetyltransferase
MKVRRLDPGDGRIFGKIRLRSLIDAPTSFAAHASDHRDFNDAEWEALLARRTAFAAFAAQDPVGLASLVPMDLSRMAHRALVTNVFVVAEYRRQGVGAALLDALEDHARDLGIVQLELAVNAENLAAIRFYEARGYTTFGRVPRGFRHGDRYFDETLMVLALGNIPDPA